MNGIPQEREVDNRRDVLIFSGSRHRIPCGSDNYVWGMFISSRVKKGEGQGKEGVTLNL